MKRVLIIDDHYLIFQGLQKYYFHPHYKLDYASSLEEARSLLRLKKFHAVLLDISLGLENGLDLFSFIPSDTYTFILTMHKDISYIEQAREIGVKGYFLKDESTGLVLEALKNPSLKDFWMSQETRKLMQHSESSVITEYLRLSPREQEVFILMARGADYNKIAQDLNISKKTVSNHREKILSKFNATNQIGIVKKAIELGIIAV